MKTLLVPSVVGMFFLSASSISASPILPTPFVGIFANGTTVTVQPWGQDQINTFDPNKAPGAPADPATPGDLPGPPVDDKGKPLIPPEEDGAAVANLHASFTIELSAPDAAGNVMITHIDITLAGNTIFYFPAGASPELKDHENGHDELYRDEYDKHARQKLTEAVNDLVGDKFPSAAKAKEAVQKVLDDRGDGALYQQMSTSGDKYDLLTNHGRNDKVDPFTGKPVDTATGVAMTKAEREFFETLRGNSSPNPFQQRTGILDPIAVFFDSSLSTLTFGGDSLIDDALNPADTILGRGKIKIQPLVWIGIKDDGTIHLSDTRLRIIDVITGDVLMNAFLLNVSYRQSSLPDFPGMIVAGLDIPPEFSGGIDNFIDSDFLSGIGHESAAGHLTAFWFFPKEPLFNSFGDIVIPNQGVTGKLVLGSPVQEPTTVPEPTTLLLVVSGLVGLGIRGRKQRLGLRRSEERTREAPR